MESLVATWIDQALAFLALPQVGLPAIFLISLISATLLPLGSEPAVYGYVRLQPDMFWVAIVVASVGNTIGGVITYAMGRGAERAVEAWRHGHPHHASEAGPPDAQNAAGTTDATGAMGAMGAARAPGATSVSGAPQGRWSQRAHTWVHRLGPPALLLSWLPGIGDPLCAVAGWLRLSFWPCTVYMAIGKALRYVAMTSLMVWAL